MSTLFIAMATITCSLRGDNVFNVHFPMLDELANDGSQEE